MITEINLLENNPNNYIIPMMDSNESIEDKEGSLRRLFWKQPRLKLLNDNERIL
jgi:hypothetical protein